MVHRNHPKYNKFVKLNFLSIKNAKTNDEIEYNIWLFVNFLKDIYFLIKIIFHGNIVYIFYFIFIYYDN